MKQKLYLIDGYGLIYKSYFAFMRNPLFNDKGQNVSALFGFFRALFSLMKKEHPEHLMVAMDAPWPTFRHEIYSEYKANRDETPQDLRDQIAPIKQMLKQLGIPTMEKQGYEADDILGTLAVQAEQMGWEAYILSADKDLLQMVSHSIFVLKPDKGLLKVIGKNDVIDDRGVRADQIIDYLALIGDSSDNVPGVKGIGPKTAVKLLSQFDTLEGIYQNIESITAKAQKKNLIENKEMAYFSKELVTIKRDVPLDMNPEDLKISQSDSSALLKSLEDLGLKSLIPDAASIFGLDAAPVEEMENKVDCFSRDDCSYYLIQDWETLELWLEKCDKSLILSLDTETTSINPMIADLAGISLSVKPKEACYIPVLAPDGEKCLEENALRKRLNEFFEFRKARLIGQNLKYDKKVLLRWGLDIGPVYFDTMIAAWVLESNNAYGLDYLAEKYLNYRMISFKDVVPKGKTFNEIPLNEAFNYAAEDADIALQLFEILKSKIKESPMDSLFYDLEMPLIDVLMRMEMTGIKLQSEELKRYSSELAEDLQRIERETYQLAGKEFNMNSPKQLQEILFDERGLPPQKKTKTGYSTDTSVLEMLSSMDPVPALILENRGLSKLKSTYVDKLPDQINPHSGRIHTSFIQTGTATGRLSSKDPNLQNIPVRDDRGRRIRSAFKADSGYQLVSADYSQIELVLLAHLSEDPGLLEAFQKGIDIHSKTAAILFNTDAEKVDSQQRRIAKSINFGVIYGMSAFRLSNELKIPRKEAADFIDTYFSEYSKVKDFIDETIAKAEEKGGVFTIAGRYRPIPAINSRNKTEKKAAQRMAVNTVIQGSAADVVKKAMLALDRYIYEKDNIKLLLQVHDEFIFEVHKDRLDSFLKDMKVIMEDIVTLKAPLRISSEVGNDWGSIH